MNDEELETGISTQISMDQKLMTVMEAELSRLQQNFDMRRKLECQKFDVDFFVDEDTTVKYYTGLTNYHILKSLFDYISQDIIVHHKSVLNKFQQLVLCLMKLRLNSSNQDLADRFNVSDTTVSRVFLNVLDILYACLQPDIHWPDREQIQKTVPMSFRAHFGTKVAVIIDCFEVFIERPSNLRAGGETWSNYKHNHTAKYLIGITPQGVVSFISDGYGGRASDKTITETCGFLNKLTPGDVVLADRGFDIQDIVGTSVCTGIHPGIYTGESTTGGFRCRTHKENCQWPNSC
ncbi:hypothetical protein SNE40_005975 [Patella caerulea]|uniref:Transposase n=1 Tax=Patella caerulea TaxID=87958 RepID=A0AAN8QAM7_PATCE